MMTANSKLRLLNTLKQGESAFATFATFKGTRAAQTLANTGLDAVIVDCEHGNVDDSEMHDMVVAISGAGCSPLVRVREGSLPVIKRALDTGAHGILVPMINSANDARSLVSCAKFSPRGVRGQGGPFACFEHGLRTPAEYVAQANDNLLTMIQIETAEGLRNIDEICQVDGIDVIVIGPNDLHLALLGYVPANWSEETFIEAVQQINNTAKAHGKKTGIVVVDGDAASVLKARFDLVVLSADVRALQGWYARELKRARS